MHTDIHASSGIRAHDSSVRAGEDGEIKGLDRIITLIKHSHTYGV
jgi:hypothetical protein